MKLPFWLTFNGLFLRGKSRQIAQIEYTIPDSFDKKLALLNIEYETESTRTFPVYQLKLLDYKKEYGLIEDFEWEMETHKITDKDLPYDERKCKELLILQKYNKIELMDFHKDFNDAKKKPFVAIRTVYDEDGDPDNMELEVVYNKTFVEQLSKKGLPGNTEEDLIEQWLKLFLISNLDDDDLLMVGEEEEIKSTSHTKMNDGNILVTG